MDFFTHLSQFGVVIPRNGVLEERILQFDCFREAILNVDKEQLKKTIPFHHITGFELDADDPRKLQIGFKGNRPYMVQCQCEEDRAAIVRVLQFIKAKAFDSIIDDFTQIIRQAYVSDKEGKRRWWWLTVPNKLLVFSSHYRLHAPLRVISLYSKIVRKGDAPNEVVLVGPDGELTFFAEDEDDRLLWIRSMVEAGCERVDADAEEVQTVDARQIIAEQLGDVDTPDKPIVTDARGCLDASFYDLRGLPRDFLNLNRHATRVLTVGNQFTRVPPDLTELTKAVYLDMSLNFITALPDALTRLTQLTTLKLAGNRFDTFPRTVLALGTLEVLDLSGNLLTELPSALGNMLNLTELWLASNALTDLPPDLARLRSLVSLDVSRNRLERLPRVLTQMPALTHLLVSGNPFDAASLSFDALTPLRWLDARDIRLTPEAQASIARLKHLEFLDISRNSLTELPSSLRSLTGLLALQASDNAIRTVHAGLLVTTSLTELDLSHNRLEAVENPHEFAKLTVLASLNLSHNALTQLLLSFKSCSELTELVLSNNELSALPASLAQCSLLERLDVSFNRIGALPSLAQLEQLTMLDACRNMLTNVGSDLGAATSLRSLLLASNSLASLPRSIGALTCLTELDCSSNKLRVIPTEVGSLPLIKCRFAHNAISVLPRELLSVASLGELCLSHNSINLVPAVLGTLVGLRVLDLSHNSISSLPPQVGKLASLTELNVSHNQIVQLPIELGSLDQLATLRAAHNSIAALPASMGELVALTELNLKANRMASVSSELCHLTRLRRLNLSHNPLPRLPDAVSNWADLRELRVSHALLTDVPAAVPRLRSLELFDASYNKIRAVPAEFASSLRLHTLVLAHNLVAELPVQVVQMAEEQLQDFDLSANPVTTPPLHSAVQAGNVAEVTVLLERGSPLDYQDTDGLAPLHYAAQLGHEDLARLLLERGADAEIRDPKGRTPLMLAVAARRFEMTHLLLDLGASPKCIDNAGMSALHVAVTVASHSLIRRFLTLGVGIDVRDGDGRTPLVVAIDQHEWPTVDLLMELGANILVPDNRHSSPVHHAVHAKSVSCVKQLLARGATLAVVDDSVHTPLHVAARNGDLETCRAILAERLAPVEAQQLMVRLGEMMLAHEQRLRSRSQMGPPRARDAPTRASIGSGDGAAAAAVAAAASTVGPEPPSPSRVRSQTVAPSTLSVDTDSSRRVSTVSEVSLDSQVGEEASLLTAAQYRQRYGVDPVIVKSTLDFCNLGDLVGRTPMHLAAEAEASEVLEFLAAQLNADVNRPDYRGMFLLHILARSGNEDLVVRLLRGIPVLQHIGSVHAARVDGKTMDQWTALHMAARHGHMGVVERLVEAGASVRETTGTGDTPLHLVALSGNVRLAQYLLAKGVDPNALNDDGMSPVFYAAREGSLALVELLAGAHATFARPDRNGVLPLHLAALGGHRDCLAYMLEHGPPSLISTVDAQQQTALHYAVLSGDLSAVRYLVAQAGADVNAPDARRATPLHLAARKGLLSVLLYLVDEGANVTLADDQGQTPFELVPRTARAELQRRAAAKPRLGVTDAPLNRREMIEMLTNGELFLKHGRQGNPHNRIVYVTRDLKQLMWRAPSARKSSATGMRLDEIKALQIGHSTANFRRTAKSNTEHLCFSVVAGERTVDLEAYKESTRDAWVTALRTLLRL